MKDYIKQLIGSVPDNLKARKLVREYCQARMLLFLQESGAFRSWIFHGGTALRFLYNIPRYSEDLDFAQEKDAGPLDFDRIIGSLTKAFRDEGYEIDVSRGGRPPVQAAFVKFRGLFFELGLSPRQSEILSVKVEVDGRPPAGGTTETTVIRRYELLHLFHYDKASLLSGKLGAILQRPYTKGRDLYDLIWYLSDPDWPNPNVPFLANGLDQTGWKGPGATWANWPELVTERLEKIDWKRAAQDVAPFLDRPSDLDFVTKENALKLLRARS